jgi:putative phosphoesterase
MKNIVLLSDTHNYFHKGIEKYIDEADEIWHAGDIGTSVISNTLKNLKPLKAVYGNIDGQDIRAEFEEFIFFETEGVSVLMMHIGGYPPKYNARSKELIALYKPHLFICGHSHILKIMPDKINNLLHINPGACGIYGWHKQKTIVLLTLDKGKVSNARVVELHG